MMFARIAALTLGAMPMLAAATLLEGRTDGDSCSTGPLQCCNSVIPANSASGSLILGLLGLVVSDPTSLIGLNCSPLTVIGVGIGNTCNTETVCCTNNNVGGLISIGCIPILL